jgi:hypothetical protein
MMDVDQAAKAMPDEEMQQEIEDFIEGFNQPTYRGMWINRQRVATCHPSTGGQGIAGLMRIGFNNATIAEDGSLLGGSSEIGRSLQRCSATAPTMLFVTAQQQDNR